MGDVPLTGQDIRASAEVHAELGPDYGDAVVESFLAKIDKQIEARVEERLASLPSRRQRQRPVDQVRLSKGRHVLAGAAAGTLAAGIPLTIMAARAMSGTGHDAKLIWVWVVLAVIFGLAAYPMRRR